MAELKGSKTEANLRTAFAGESEARNKYTYYASKAKKDGYEQIAALFLETAENEQEHAKIWFKLLHDGGIPDTITNLKDAAAGENYEWTDMYAGFEVVPVPGACAFATLVSVAGSGGKTLIFEGFLSPKPGRRRSRLKELMDTGAAVVLYESPFRIVKLLSDIADIDSGRRVVVGREMTKLHEEIIEGTAAEMRDNFSERQKILGEFAVFISGNFNAQLSDEECR